MDFFRTNINENFNILSGSFLITSFDLAYNLSKIIDFMNKNLTQHHHRVAYIATAISAEYGLELDRVKNTTLAALLHDIGLMVTSEIKNLSTFDIGDDGKLSH